jgi:hypothetical protein
MADIPWPMWTRPHTTDEVMPLDVTGPEGQITSFLVAVTTVGDPEPLAGVYTAAEADGEIRGPRVGVTRNQTAGTYWAWAKVTGRVLPPVPFVLT